MDIADTDHSALAFLSAEKIDMSFCPSQDKFAFHSFQWFKLKNNRDQFSLLSKPGLPVKLMALLVAAPTYWKQIETQIHRP